MNIIFILLIVYQIKHFVADYLLQNSYMLGKFKDEGWLFPLMAHTSMHGVATLIIALMAGLSNTDAVILGLMDMFAHSIIDRVKVDLSSGLNPQKDKSFWWYLGGDQMFHHLTHYLIIWLMITYI